MLKNLITRCLFRFRTMTPEDYLFNQRDAMLAKTPHTKVLQPLADANQGDALVSD